MQTQNNQVQNTQSQKIVDQNMKILSFRRILGFGPSRTAIYEN